MGTQPRSQRPFFSHVTHPPVALLAQPCFHLHNVILRQHHHRPCRACVYLTVMRCTTCLHQPSTLCDCAPFGAAHCIHRLALPLHCLWRLLPSTPLESHVPPFHRSRGTTRTAVSFFPTPLIFPHIPTTPDGLTRPLIHHECHHWTTRG